MDRRANHGTESFGVLLRGHRGNRGLTQEELAERAGLHAQEISRLERDVVRSPRSTTVALLADALKLDAHEKEAFAAAARREPTYGSHPRIEVLQEPGPPPPVSLADAEALLGSMPRDILPERASLPTGSRMPLAPNPLFVGRGDELSRIAAALKGGETTVSLGQVVASTGLGGLGKTQLAVELVHRYGRYFAGGVFWLSFARANEIPLQVAGCSGTGAVGLELDVSSRSLEEQLKLVTTAWQSAIPRLLVFDNCEEEGLLDAWRPTSGGSRVLVTSRRSHWSPTLGVTAFPLDLLPRTDSIELLRRYRHDLAPADPELDAIAQELGDLPLALHLAGSYLRTYRTEVDLDEYLAELRRSEVVQHASMLGAGLDDSVSPTRHVQGVAQTFALCLNRLDQTRDVDRVAIALLARMACMAPGEPISRALLARTLGEVSPRLCADGLHRLNAVGLVAQADAWARVHRLLVHFVRQEGLDRSGQSAVDQVLIGCGDEARRGLLTGVELTAAIPHVVDVASRESDDRLRLASLYRSVGLTLLAAGDIRSPRRWLERSLEISESVHGPDHPETAASLNDLSEQLRAQGEFGSARTLQERALATRERALGRSHLDTAQSANNLGLIVWMQGDAAAARSLIEHAVAVWEQTAGPETTTTAVGLNNLARVLVALGDLDTAQPLQERAVRICEREYGPHHLFTSNALNSLARVLEARGNLDRARALFERVLAIRLHAVGHEHIQTAGSFHNLGMLVAAQSDPAAARPLFARALAIRERVLGPDHPDTVATRRALAELAAEGDGPAASG